ncbi:MAG TPA: ATP-dependent Clp protease proteolytic subunit [Armatimonadota bacterium]|nr:ATP-dependent Clp protease proteolytic subunit [Armatimonadota bacterium]
MAQDEAWKPEDRFLYLIGEITDEQTQDLVQQLLRNWDREFLLVINSDGGSSFNAHCLVNLMQEHGRIDTLCIGVALSGAADCLAAGRRRYIIPGAIAMLHQVSWEMGREFMSNLVKNAQFLERLNSDMGERLARHTGRSPEELERDMATDFYLFGQEIIDYGLADGFWTASELLPAPSARGVSRLRARGERRKSRRPEPPQAQP